MDTMRCGAARCAAQRFRTGRGALPSSLPPQNPTGAALPGGESCGGPAAESDTPVVLNDAVIRTGEAAGTAGERRAVPRRQASSEVVVRWHFDPGSAVRYRVLDMTDDGLRLLTAAPLVAGMSGTAVSLLPRGSRIGRVCLVRWVRPLPEGGYEAGLRLL